MKLDQKLILEIHIKKIYHKCKGTADLMLTFLYIRSQKYIKMCLFLAYKVKDCSFESNVAVHRVHSGI